MEKIIERSLKIRKAYHNLEKEHHGSCWSVEEDALAYLTDAGPMSAGQIAEATGIDRKEIDKAMKMLKESGEIVSPKRCYWEPKN